jgi:cytochrome c2
MLFSWNGNNFSTQRIDFMKQAILVMVLLFILAACTASGSPEATEAPLPVGDAARGEELFNSNVGGAPACGTCHRLTDESLVGPGLLGYGERAGSEVEGQSAEEYTYQSIVRPAEHIVEGFNNVMYTEYQSKLSPQEIADLIAYLLSQ